MILENINGKKLSLVVWGTDKKGEDDVQVFAGIARHENDKLYLERDDGKILIQDEWLNKITCIST